VDWVDYVGVIEEVRDIKLALRDLVELKKAELELAREWLKYNKKVLQILKND